ncbi:HypC/HybG/HupF family hydrogenase formation chaperone [Sedimenticola selenatireducens]|uniref:HypC/HybG/HupF family hydrogenase formation chaperone n=1 Tax=Sedimenticola selenatireducens TaxID=191960 RepID=A0A557S9X0_9GAMM|nr:HypC/HybG/HupF family hydrogenase formation chaperone [Sedimenticola selenatireducens]TVO74222.1 HypC/HybG/HupF family hydrogenase formation chaperone [Sedimenticola selenatireducens]TVT62551.1 MAG: HypC/HybG/HupF family hydrogenase formation chaperone [Sedimenticola selenatireducens]
MCLAIPGKVVALDEATDMATVSVGNVKKDVSIALVEDVNLGDYLLIHVGYALNKISEEEAANTLKMFEEAGLTEADV